MIGITAIYVSEIYGNIFLVYLNVILKSIVYRNKWLEN